MDDEGTGYPISCERLTGSAAVLDFILQISDKQWCYSHTITDFLRCLEEACHDRFGKTGQGVFCSFERDHKVDWKKGTTEPRK
jgi:hypothetical protein